MFLIDASKIRKKSCDPSGLGPMDDGSGDEEGADLCFFFAGGCVVTASLVVGGSLRLVDMVVPGTGGVVLTVVRG